ncbi:sensor histidine kinase [Pseudofulvimonas gallinarii]|uniref:histidine kinase n=1 Tax=Pseudofulvimonas gallinarii TaxID=634155 RepID=A0A4R3LS97_9GAMM|nr:histidine kinase [Pseudofulvimonas gallinarii]TCT01455.1 signal transduction histidine kinase [Pseudofulvimonas gallinarii]
MKGLRLQLAVFYILLSLPALLLIERAVFGWKFENMLRQLADGRVEALLQHEAVSIDEAMAAGAREEELKLRLQHLVLRLERPRESLGTSAAFVLLELTPHPFEARLRTASGERIAADTPRQDAPDWLHRAWSMPVPDRAGREPWQLDVDLAVPTPWRLSLEAVSFEWRLAVAYLVIFLLGSAWFLRWRVLGRVSRMAEAAGAWARGDFSVALADRNSDELGRLAQALDRMAADVQALVGTRARLASLEERQRLARDLHDTVKQKAFALSLQLSAARDSASETARQQRLQEAQGLMAEIQHELAELLQDMRGEPSDALAEVDLVPALSSRLDDFTRRSGLVGEAALPESVEVPADTADAVLRVYDEALSNVWRHAAARHVRVQLAPLPEGWALSVEDDGRGLGAASRDGMGMNNMRERSRAIGARFEVHGGAGGGTRLLLVFPEGISRP